MTDYGIDVAMTPDALHVDPTFGSVTGRRCLAECLVRRLMTPPGGLLDDPDFGYDLIGEINDDLSQGDVGRIAAQSAAECAKDERVVQCSGKAVFLDGVLTLSLVVTDGTGPFKLVLAASAVTVQLLQGGI